jgi:4-hydroxy-3-methylbut-2-en-1-yl diphosphate reductase
VRDLRIDIDRHAGFCWGVVRTIQIAEDELAQGNALVSLGDVIHNPGEIKRMNELGMRPVSADELPALPAGTRVLIRAHGEPPETYRAAQGLGIQLVDATCPVVTRLQERIRKFHDDGYQIVIFGKKDHAEVIGLRGVCRDDCIVVLSLDEARSAVDLTRKTVLFSQTTMDKPTFNAIKEYCETRIAELVVDSMEQLAVEFHAKDTICGQVSGRETKLREFAAGHDVVLFLAGRKSSNGKVLFDICRDANPNAHFIEDASELDASWFGDAATVGISGATSTPHWQMDQVRDAVAALVSNIPENVHTSSYSHH